MQGPGYSNNLSLVFFICTFLFVLSIVPPSTAKWSLLHVDVWSGEFSFPVLQSLWRKQLWCSFRSLPIVGESSGKGSAGNLWVKLVFILAPFLSVFRYSFLLPKHVNIAVHSLSAQLAVKIACFFFLQIMYPKHTEQCGYQYTNLAFLHTSVLKPSSSAQTALATNVCLLSCEEQLKDNFTFLKHVTQGIHLHFPVNEQTTSTFSHCGC